MTTEYPATLVWSFTLRSFTFCDLLCRALPSPLCSFRIAFLASASTASCFFTCLMLILPVWKIKEARTTTTVINKEGRNLDEYLYLSCTASPIMMTRTMEMLEITALLTVE